MPGHHASTNCSDLVPSIFVPSFWLYACTMAYRSIISCPLPKLCSSQRANSDFWASAFALILRARLWIISSFFQWSCSWSYQHSRMCYRVFCSRRQHTSCCILFSHLCLTWYSGMLYKVTIWCPALLKLSSLFGIHTDHDSNLFLFLWSSRFATFCYCQEWCATYHNSCYSLENLYCQS